MSSTQANLTKEYLTQMLNHWKKGDMDSAWENFLLAAEEDKDYPPVRYYRSMLLLSNHFFFPLLLIDSFEDFIQTTNKKTEFKALFDDALTRKQGLEKRIDQYGQLDYSGTTNRKIPLSEVSVNFRDGQEFSLQAPTGKYQYSPAIGSLNPGEDILTEFFIEGIGQPSNFSNTLEIILRKGEQRNKETGIYLNFRQDGTGSISHKLNGEYANTAWGWGDDIRNNWIECRIAYTEQGFIEFYFNGINIFRDLYFKVDDPGKKRLSFVLAKNQSPKTLFFRSVGLNSKIRVI